MKVKDCYGKNNLGTDTVIYLDKLNLERSPRPVIKTSEVQIVSWGGGGGGGGKKKPNGLLHAE